jgi:hypothetical protein
MNKKDAISASATLPWAKSYARRKLYLEITNGQFDNLNAAAVQKSCPEYQEYGPKQFASNLRYLRKSIKILQTKAANDKVALQNDLVYHRNKRLNGLKQQTQAWHGCDARKYLRNDIAAGKHLLMRPAVLRQTRPAYMEISLKCFRGRIYQEKRTMLEKSYWLFNKSRSKINRSGTLQPPQQPLLLAHHTPGSNTTSTSTSTLVPPHRR